MGVRKGRRRSVAVFAALLAVGVTTVVGYRVLAPAEVVTAARADYPALADPPVGVIGRLPTAPLIVDGRLRIYATIRQVWADRPADRRYRSTPYWSYRRWPAQVESVVAAGTTVVSRWSDGQLVALDARTGRVAWRVEGPSPQRGYTGRRTGAVTVWAPAGLHTATAPTGRRVVVAVGAARVGGYDLETGRELWRDAFDAGCRSSAGSTASGQLVSVDRCADPQVLEFRDAATGTVGSRWRPPGGSGPLAAVTMLDCVTPRSDCRAVRLGGAEPPGSAGSTGSGAPAPAGQAWLVAVAGPPVAIPALDPGGALLAGEVVVVEEAGVVVGRSVRTGQELWRRTDLGPARPVAVQPGRVHLLTERRDLVTVDPASGVEQSRFPMVVGRDGIRWAPGHAYAVDGYVVVERLRQPVDPGAEDRAYYQAVEPLVLAAT